MTRTLLGLTTKIKKLLEKKNHLFKSYIANVRLAVDRVRLQKVVAELINIIKSSKENFRNNLAKKLNDTNTSSVLLHNEDFH